MVFSLQTAGLLPGRFCISARKRMIRQSMALSLTPGGVALSLLVRFAAERPLKGAIMSKKQLIRPKPCLILRAE
jgi:hypothetical protein